MRQAPVPVAMERVMDRTASVVLLASWMALTAARAAGAADLRVGDETVAFDPGPGYCILDEGTYEVDRVLFDIQRKANAGINDVVAIFVDCAELDGMRAGTGAGMSRYGILLATHIKGRLQKVRGVDRASFLDQVAQVVEQGIDIDEKTITERVNQALDPALRDEMGDLTVSGLRQLGMLHRDGSAIYQGLLARSEAAGMSKVVAGVSAQTLVHGYVLQYSLYRDYADQGTLDALLGEIRPLMTDLVARNDPAGAPVSAAGSGGGNWDDIGVTAVVGIVAGGLFAAVLLSRRRRKPPSQ